AAWLGFRHDTRTRVDGNAADVVAHQFAFAGMHSRAHFDAKLPDRSHDRERAAYRSPRAVECREKAVAGGIGFLASKARQFLSHNRVVRVQETTPSCVAKRRRALGGRRDVEKEHGGQDTIWIIDRSFPGDELLD